MPINEFWFYFGTVYHENKTCINYATKGILITHITHQMLSALNYLKSLHIRHRDSDEGNIFIMLIHTTRSTLHIYFIDFARADLPYAQDLQYTQSPDLKLDHRNCTDSMDAVELERSYMKPDKINKYCGIRTRIHEARQNKQIQIYTSWKEPSDFLSFRMKSFRMNLQDEILQDEMLCSDFFTGEANKNVTKKTILKEHNKGACSLVLPFQTAPNKSITMQTFSGNPVRLSR